MGSVRAHQPRSSIAGSSRAISSDTPHPLRGRRGFVAEQARRRIPGHSRLPKVPPRRSKPKPPRRTGEVEAAPPWNSRTPPTAGTAYSRLIGLERRRRHPPISRSRAGRSRRAPEVTLLRTSRTSNGFIAYFVALRLSANRSFLSHQAPGDLSAGTDMRAARRSWEREAVDAACRRDALLSSSNPPRASHLHRGQGGRHMSILGPSVRYIAIGRLSPPGLRTHGQSVKTSSSANLGALGGRCSSRLSSPSVS